MDCGAIYFSDSEEENSREHALQRRILRDRSNVLEMPNKRYIYYFYIKQFVVHETFF